MTPLPIETVPMPEPGFAYGRWVLIYLVVSGASPLLRQTGWHRGRVIADRAGGHLSINEGFLAEHGPAVRASHWCELPDAPPQVASSIN